MKKVKSLIKFIVTLVCIMGIVYYSHSVNPIEKTNNVYYLGYFSQIPPNYDELLKQTYGKSPYYTLCDNTKISIEKTVQEKYYIIYSWVSGDQSYFGVTALIENIEKDRLDHDSFEYLYIKDEQGKSYLPLPYYSLIDFPPDQPLGWKQILYVKFSPLDKGVESIDIYITYKGEEKVIKGVPIG